MIINIVQFHWLIFLSISIVSCKGQGPTEQFQDHKNKISSELSNGLNAVLIDTLIVENAPNKITRSMIQDKAGNIWFATFGGVFKYDGRSFINITEDVSKDRFFSVLEDSKGNLWFGSVGSGVYLYDGESFQNFTTNEGLINNEIVCIYEDKNSNIWFGANGGASKYDGDSFQNFMINGESMIQATTGDFVPNFQRPMNEINSIVEDKKGQFWFGTRGNTFKYDGLFTSISENGIPFTNVRWILEDKGGNIWLGGNDGLWKYDGTTYSNILKKFVGYIYEDKEGNIWTSAQKSPNNWALSHYKASDNGKYIVTDIKTEEGMFFGILEDSDGNIWTGTLNGVCRYNGATFSYFRREGVE